MKRSIAMLLALAMMLAMISGAIGEQDDVVEPDLDVGFEIVTDDTCESNEDLVTDEAPSDEIQEVTEGVLVEEIPAASPVAVPVEKIPDELTEAISYRPGVVLTTDGAESLAVYNSPGGQCIAGIDLGQMIEIGTVCDGWAMIRCNGLTGYVYSNCVALYNSEAAPEEKIRSIVITTNIDGMTQVREGMVVVLTATLIGFEDDVYTVQWQYSTDGGATAIDVGGANSLAYAYRLSSDNFNYMYRIVVTIVDTHTNAAE